MDESLTITVEGKEIRISNPQKILWPETGFTKLYYVNFLLSVADYLLPYSKNRLLMMWCYPDGVNAKRIVRKAMPSFAPAWIQRTFYIDKHWILLNDRPTLAWLANLAALELHVPFDTYDRIGYPTELVFDLDPMDTDNFELVLETALQLKDLLDSLGLKSFAKTSGSTGLQVYVPIEPKYEYRETRMVNEFIAKYMVQKNPDKITIDRVVKRRGKKLYFDYLQLWKMRTLPAPYSSRATATGTVSTPVTWEEVRKGFSPTDFTMVNIIQRIQERGDLFSPVTTEKNKYMQSLDKILAFLKTHKSVVMI
ncbi:non-homologous end-joining DNA ligase [Zhaonella formicivorans]|uniref:non-homologous end-joining DNA ligase n=1 Tax=Zhaonella formicivorans TaxID=2528593 RepID=UPI0010E90821|nr:non-homologous end-joining DNA ligase [Zhaonella formicivorans]